MYMNRPINYRMKSLEGLLTCYADETSRMNADDRNTTQRLIKNEVLMRIEDTFKMIDEQPEDVQQIYNQLLNH